MEIGRFKPNIVPFNRWREVGSTNTTLTKEDVDHIIENTKCRYKILMGELFTASLARDYSDSNYAVFQSNIITNSSSTWMGSGYT